MESPRPDDDGRTEFERFEALTRALVAVPKADVDKKRKKP